VYEVRRQLLEKNESIASQRLRNTLKGTNETARMLMKKFQQHNDELETLIGKDFSPATLERYKTSYDHTKSSMHRKCGVLDIDIKRLDYDFFQILCLFLPGPYKALSIHRQDYRPYKNATLSLFQSYGNEFRQMHKSSYALYHNLKIKFFSTCSLAQ